MDHKRKGKGHIRVSFWVANSEVFGSDKLMRKWGRRITTRKSIFELQEVEVVIP